MSGASDCIFCRIAAGDIPCTRVFEDEYLLAFLDVAPLAPGHTLLIPRAHHSCMQELPAELAARMGAVLPLLSDAVQKAVESAGVNILQNNGKVAGQVVEHVHVHIIPRQEGDGLGYRWNTCKCADERMQQISDRISAILQP